MKLYFAPGACSLASDIALREAGIDFELAKVSLADKKVSDGEDFSAVNPKGYVPALKLDDGTVLTENAALLPYIADLNPSAGLAPKSGTLDRYRMHEWLAFINSEVHKQFSPFFNPRTPEAQKQTAKAALQKRLGTVEQTLATQDFLLGSQFSVPDSYLFTVLRWAPHANLDLSAFPAVQAFMERVRRRPAVEAAINAENAAA